MTTDTSIETWEAKRDREKQESITARRNLYDGVALYLQGWHVTESDDEYLGYRFKLEDGLGHRVTIETARTPRNMWHVSGYWPQRANNGSYYVPSDVHEESPSINVSTSKTHEQIARDITKRFLPEYLRIFAKIQDKVAVENDYATRRAKNWERIAGWVDTYSASHLQEQGKIRIKSNADGSKNYDAGYGDINMESADSVKIELRSLPIETALAVLELLQKGWR